MHVTTLVASLGLVACAGTAPPVPSNTTPAPAPTARGTSGYETVSWGDPISSVHNAATTFEELPAVVVFEQEGGGVSAVHVRMGTIYPTLEACAGAWQTLRARLDARFGASQSDNLAASWTTKTAAITAACNPGRGGAAGLTIEYARR